MTTLHPERLDDLASAVRAAADLPRLHEERPPLVTGARAVRGVLDRDQLVGLGGMVRFPGTLQGGTEAFLAPLRDDLEGVLARAFGPVEVHTVLQLRSVAHEDNPGWATEVGHPLPCVAAGPNGEGWWTAVQLLIPIEVPGGCRWTIHTATGDLMLDEPGSAAFVAPQLPVTRQHPPLTDPLVWLSGTTRMRFRHRWVDPRAWLRSA
jgi:hypothetical protein